MTSSMKEFLLIRYSLSNQPQLLLWFGVITGKAITVI